ncbi:MAG: HD domain-containing phosphohydrolase [Cyanobacteria bacterium P01_F01_bin.33]
MRPESTLSRLKAALPEGELPSSFGVYLKNTLVALCHALEDHILQTDPGNSDLRPLLLVTFQEGKWYLQEADRYFDLAQCSSHVAIAAVPDSGFAQHKTSQLDNVHLVDLAGDDTYAEEWNLIILAPNYAAMVLCHELADDEYGPRGRPDVDLERKFYGLWTFERQAVEAAAEIAIDRIRLYDAELADSLSAARETIAAQPDTAPADLSNVVSRVVSYLQSSQQQLVAVNRQTRELWELEGQAKTFNRNLAANKLQAFLRMAQRVDSQDPFNSVASLQVSALCETLGQILDLPTLNIRRLRLAGLLFRIGLAEAPEELFSSTPEQLQAANSVFWRDRSISGARLLSSMPELDPISHIVKHHLERWDGSGRPNGLKGEEIPLEARILNLAAFFQDLTQPRGERSALSLGEALARCQARSGERFDPKLVESLQTVIRLAEIGLMKLPERPSEIPEVWLEEPTPQSSSVAAS